MTGGVTYPTLEVTKSKVQQYQVTSSININPIEEVLMLGVGNKDKEKELKVTQYEAADGQISCVQDNESSQASVNDLRQELPMIMYLEEKKDIVK